MKLITEINEEGKIITEQNESGGKNFYIEGIFMQAELPNRNNRMYSLPILQKETNRYVTEFVKKNRAYGELGHPDGPNINLERVSHLIKSLRQEGNNFIGKAKIMDTPYGNIVKNLLSEGATIGVSTRGMGSLVEGKNGIKIVKDDFHLATAADIVADPSAPDAYVRGIMEGKEWVWDNGIIREADVVKQKEVIQGSSKKNLEENMIKVFQDFISKL
jgi:Prohead core protein serine protease